MSAGEMPRPPYVLLFEERNPDAPPLAIMVEGRGALPLFDSESKARDFLSSTSFGWGWRPAEVPGARLIRVLESLKDQVEYVALNPPPAAEGGMRVRMGSLTDLIDALKQSRREDDLFGLG